LCVPLAAYFVHAPRPRAQDHPLLFSLLYSILALPPRSPLGDDLYHVVFLPLPPPVGRVSFVSELASIRRVLPVTTTPLLFFSCRHSPFRPTVRSATRLRLPRLAIILLRHFFFPPLRGSPADDKKPSDGSTMPVSHPISFPPFPAVCLFFHSPALCGRGGLAKAPRCGSLPLSFPRVPFDPPPPFFRSESSPASEAWLLVSVVYFGPFEEGMSRPLGRSSDASVRFFFVLPSCFRSHFFFRKRMTWTPKLPSEGFPFFFIGFLFSIRFFPQGLLAGAFCVGLGACARPLFPSVCPPSL